MQNELPMDYLEQHNYRIVRAMVTTERDKCFKFTAPADPGKRQGLIQLPTDYKLGGNIVITNYSLTVYANDKEASIQKKYMFKPGDIVDVLQVAHKDDKWDGEKVVSKE